MEEKIKQIQQEIAEEYVCNNWGDFVKIFSLNKKGREQINESIIKIIRYLIHEPGSLVNIAEDLMVNGKKKEIQEVIDALQKYINGFEDE